MPFPKIERVWKVRLRPRPPRCQNSSKAALEVVPQWAYIGHNLPELRATDTETHRDAQRRTDTDTQTHRHRETQRDTQRRKRGKGGRARRGGLRGEGGKAGRGEALL